FVSPLVRDSDGVLRAASWPEAIGAAAAGLAAARGRAGVLTGGRLTLEDAYAYAKFARVALGSNDIDSRARPHSAEEEQFLAARALTAEGAVILAGERLAETPGALSALARLASASGASLAWVPRRAGERGAVEAGALPDLLPGGRPVSDPAARAEVASAWGVAALPAEPGRAGREALA